MKRLLKQRNEEDIEIKAIQAINEITERQQIKQYQTDKEKKRKATKRINQTYLIEEGRKHAQIRNKNFS